MRMTRFRICISAAGLFVLTLASAAPYLAAQSGGGQNVRGDWPLFGGDTTNSRYSPLDAINTQNVKNLAGAWTFKFENNASTRAGAVEKDGVLYVSAGTRLYALDARSGKTIWSWRPSEKAPQRLEAANIGDLLNAGFGIPGPQGVALGEGMVFVGLMDGHVAAVREKTGEPVWATQIGYDPPKTGQSVSGAPIYADGMVFAGLADGDWAFRGKVAALDAKTGKKVWEFYTIPGPGEPGHDSWGQPNNPNWKHIWAQGGAGVWHAGTVDPSLGLVYFVTGNAVPMFGGEARKGNNLYTASILALETKTGKLKWYYQVVHHDLWDADIALPPILFDAQVNGRTQKAIAAMRADGYLFMLNRETGKPVLPIEERKVTQDAYNQTSPTQPFPVNADSLAPDCSYWEGKVKPPFVLDCTGFTPPFVDKHNIVAPVGGVAGVIRVTPMSYSPQTGYFYAQGSGGVTRARRISKDPWFRGNAPMLDLLPASVNVLAAIDSRTNKIAWKHELPQGGIGTSGPLATGGGLLFRGDPSGNFEAYDAKTGQSLWQFQTGVGGARGPAMSYQVDGEQYVAVAMGSAFWAFKLGGTLTPQPAPRSGRGAPQPDDTEHIETSRLVQSAERGVGLRYAVDEDSFNPIRARITRGATVTFTNNGTLMHTIVSDDGTWSTTPLVTAESAYIKFDRAGTFRYHCKEHPWAIGEITVVEPKP
jgi:alcohol dehydrogenase (cytochrome c)